MNRLFNNRKRNLILAFLLLCCLSWTGFAQQNAKQTENDQPGIFITSKAHGDSIVLRWAPTDAGTWQSMRETGYYLLKIEHLENERLDSTWLFPNPLKPLSLEELKASVDTTDKYVTLAAQAMYGDDLLLTDKPPRGMWDEMNKAHDMFQMRFYFALQAADLSKEAADVLSLRWVDKKVKKDAFYSYVIMSDTINENPKIRGGITEIANTKDKNEISPQGLQAFPADKQIELQWYRDQVGEFTMFYVERSDDGGKTYKRLHEDPYFTSFDEKSLKHEDAKIRTLADVMHRHHIYIDSIPENYKDYKYRVRGIDAFADVSKASEPITAHGIDLTPPPPTQIETVENIFQNHVLLQWKTPQPMEEDVAGFKVKRGHDPEGPFYELHTGLLPKNTTSFLDTSASALQAIYYVLAIEDKNGNSSYSYPRLGILTDSIAPNPPKGLQGIVDTNGLVFLKWDHNKESDLNGYKVYKSYDQNGTFIQVTSYALKENGYIDTIDVRSLDRRVYYKLVAVDRSNNHSQYSEPFTLEKPILNPPTTPVISKIYAKDFGIHLNIIGSRSEGVKEHEIFRKKADESWESIAIVEKDKNNFNFQFIDTKVVSRVSYTYAVEAVDSTGIRSPKSQVFSTSIYELKPLPEIKSLTAQYNNKEKEVELAWTYESNENIHFVIYKGVQNEPMAPWRSVGQETKCVDLHITNGNFRYAVKAINKDTKEETILSAPVTVFVNID